MHQKSKRPGHITQYNYKVANYQKFKYYIYIFLIFYTLISVYTLVVSKQTVVWDAGTCLKMTDNAAKKIPFNYYEHPSPSNLSKDETEFVTWWSPGQFALPLLIKTITNFKISVAVKILTFLCLLASALGIYKLYHRLIAIGLSNTGKKQSEGLITYVALIFVLMQPFFWRSLCNYDGGGLLMLCYCPWFIYWVTKIKQLNLYSFFGLLIAALIGFFLKTSFTSILLGALLYLFLYNSIIPANSFKNQNFRLIIKNGIILAVVFFAYILITKIGFLSHNKNIADSSMGIRMQPRVVLYPIVAPVLGAFGFSFLDKTIEWFFASVLIIPLYYFIYRSKNVTAHYKIILTGFLGACIAFFSLIYFINIDVSYELRHYIIISILILPVFFIIFHKLPIAQYVLYSVFVLTFGLNIYQFAKQFSGSIEDKKPVVTYTGFQSSYPNPVIEKIHSLDSVKNNSIFYFQSHDPSVALEVRNNRTLFEDNYINFHFDNQMRTNKTLYYGLNSGEIYVIYKDSQIKIDSASNLTRFENYKKFNSIYESDGYTIFRAVPSIKKN